MKISKNIDNVIWEIEMNHDHKNKSNFISWEQFAGPLLDFKEHVYPDHVYDTMKKLKPGFGVTKNFDSEEIRIINKSILPKHLILELTEIFNVNPYFPLDITLLNTDTKQKYYIHFKKDGSSSMKWTYKVDQNNLPDPTPANPCTTHDKHWL